jgi:hypothetical protein
MPVLDCSLSISTVLGVFGGALTAFVLFKLGTYLLEEIPWQISIRRGRKTAQKGEGNGSP